MDHPPQRDSTLPWNVQILFGVNMSQPPIQKKNLGRNNVSMYTRVQIDNVWICMDPESIESYIHTLLCRDLPLAYYTHL